MIYPEGAGDYTIGEPVSFSPGMPMTVIQLPSSTDALFRFEDPDIVYLELIDMEYATVEHSFTIYYRDAPPGAVIDLDMGDGSSPYRYAGDEGTPDGGGWIQFGIIYPYDKVGQFTVTARMYTKDGSLISEGSILVIVSTLIIEYGIDGRVPSGD